MKRITMSFAATIALGLLANTAMAAPQVFDHFRTTATANNECGTDPGEAICLTFKAGPTIDMPLQVEDVMIAHVNGTTIKNVDNDTLSQEEYWFDELDIKQVKAYKLTEAQTYISTINGRSVGQLCNVHMKGKQLLKAQDITMVVDKDSNGNFTCHRQ